MLVFGLTATDIGLLLIGITRLSARACLIFRPGIANKIRTSAKTSLTISCLIDRFIDLGILAVNNIERPLQLIIKFTSKYESIKIKKKP